MCLRKELEPVTLSTHSLLDFLLDSLFVVLCIHKIRTRQVDQTGYTDSCRLKMGCTIPHFGEDIVHIASNLFFS